MGACLRADTREQGSVSAVAPRQDGGQRRWRSSIPRSQDSQRWSDRGIVKEKIQPPQDLCELNFKLPESFWPACFCAAFIAILQVCA